MNESLFPDDSHEPEAVSQSSESPESPELSESSVTSDSPHKKRRRGSRGGRGRTRPAGAPESAEDGDDFGDGDLEDGDSEDDDFADDDDLEDGDFEDDVTVDESAELPGVALDFELPERMSEGRPDADVAEAALVQRPKIGDTRSSSVPATPPLSAQGSRGVTMPGGTRAGGPRPGERRAKGRAAAPKNSSEVAGETVENPVDGAAVEGSGADAPAKKKRKRNNKARGGADIRHNDRTDADVVERRRGRERNGRPIGRYFMAVQVRADITQVAVMEGRSLIEHYVSRPADDESQIHGNIYVGKVQNILPGMEAAFVDIGTQKNAVLYRGDVQYDAEDIVDSEPRIEQILKGKQLIVCQITKNPIGLKGARLTQEVSLAGRFVVLIPNSRTYGISKRLPDDVRKRLRSILDRVKPEQHGLIVRTAAEAATEHELHADMTRLLDQWAAIEAKAAKAGGPTLLYREPPLAVRVIREEFNSDYRGVVIDDRQLFEDVHSYVSAFNPELADRVEYFDPAVEGLPIFEKNHVHEQIHKALDRKVWLPSGGSLIIEHTEALTVIDVNTGRNVGTSNLEATVFANNLEAAEEVAHQLRLRDIGGIIVIDFIDMEIKENRRKVVDAFKSALSRDKTRTQVFDISELGLVEMTRKRIGEGLLTNFADQCPNCEGRGIQVNHDLLN
ncbi:MAG: Rne/Rng family ribonuclease [Actinobacteria bacterium]|nr:Rne/Rng family ribonuclease [Actinomycetota bacterium]